MNSDDDILIAADETPNLRLLVELLEKGGCRVRSADMAQIAQMAIASAMAKPPGLILLDVRMPETDGFEVCRRLKQNKRTRNIPVLFVSAPQDIEDRVRGFEAGGVDFFTEPFEELEVLARVRTHMRLHKMQLHLEQLVDERTERLQAEIASHQEAEESLREREAKLQESEERFRGVMEQSPLAIEILTPEGQIAHVNTVWMALWGVNEEETAKVLAQYNILTDQQAMDPGVMPLIRKAFAGEPVVLPAIEYAANRRAEEIGLGPIKGNSPWIQCHLVPVKNANQEIMFVVNTYVDITERKRSEEQMNVLQSELLHATRRGTMGELTAALAHELNHPLGSILNNANAAKRYLAQNNPDLDEIRDIIDDIISEDRRASEVMQKVRHLMKKTRVGFAQVKINRIIEEVIKLTQSELIIENVSLSKHFAESLPEIAGERIQLQQVFINLILNAIDAMKESNMKQLHISTAQHDAKSIMIRVSDTGSGFGQEEGELLFKPFLTTKKEGMGMGLSVTRTIIKSHGGEIWAENNKQAGASFFITLPVNKGKSS